MDSLTRWLIFIFRPDPNGIIAFLVDALQAAEDAGDRAYIIGHIPLGKEDTLVDQVPSASQLLAPFLAAQLKSYQVELLRPSPPALQKYDCWAVLRAQP
jgi:hypothetical protein